MNNILKSVCEHFSLGSMPFLQRTKTPFEGNSFLKNMALISAAFFSRHLVVVTGMAGSGKSSLLFYALNQLDPSSFRVCHVELSNPNKKALYKAIAVKMGLTPAFNGDDIKLQIISFFNEENEQGKFNCVIIDEAHTLSIPMIDELRSFYDEGANFSLVLAGLPPLLSKTMNLSVNQPMKQRINLWVEPVPMTPAESMEYILYQLDIAKARNPIFDDKCYPVIHQLSSGLPRRMNQLCYRVLIQAYIDKKSIITADDITALCNKTPHIFDKAIPADADTTTVQFQK
ncbi:MAG: AAA family ATPase [Erysipelothrix sp.]|uniref:ExeA family protein n=1 Tax=Desulfitibacter alkalitolerans TaxID=264641 RepID=UPI0004870F38|nr:AAA family ATPase [Desulfitibacter alkalitolerans]MBS3987902.1 AAA family ATPase [Erysipelothrix sp.]